MLSQIIVPTGDILDLRDNASSFEEDGNFLDDRLQEQHQRGSEEVDDNEDIRVLMIRGEKIVTSTASAKLPIGKLLMVLTKMILVENG